MRNLLIFLAAMTLSFAYGGSSVDHSFKYQNPINSGIEGGIRDCEIIRANGKWFMTGTSPGFWKGQNNPGVRLYSSDSLLDWKSEGLLIDRSKLDPTVWYHDRFWAPELHKWQGRWYLAFSGCNESKEHQHDFGCCLAVADDIHGPYTVITPDKPIVNAIDLHLFFDNGKSYAFWSGIGLCEIDLENARLVGRPRTILAKSADKHAWDSIGVEGPWCLKRNGKYYLFYSSWTRGYEVGYATADSLEGPWTKSTRNPIYGEVNQKTVAKNNPDSPFLGAGHNAVFTGPDGQLWLSCHGQVKGSKELLCIDPIRFDADGEILFSGPSWQPREITIP